MGGLSLVGASGLQGLGELVGVSTPATTGEEEEDDEEDQQFILDPSVFTVQVSRYPFLLLHPPLSHLPLSHITTTPISYITYS